MGINNIGSKLCFGTIERTGNMVKLLHCADLHLGSSLKGLKTLAKSRSAELGTAFLKIVSLCREENINLLLIAGDLFDAPGENKELAAFVRDGLASIPETTVAIAPGNHDPFTPDSPYSLEGFWPENVHIFKEPEAVILEHLGVRLIGAGFTSMYERTPLLKVAAPEDGYINIGVLHGMAVSKGQASDYNPVYESYIAASGLDYLALGHVHMRTNPPARAGRTSYAYCGCPEGRGFDELGALGVYIGSVAKGHCDLAFRAVCSRMCLAEEIDITGVSPLRLPEFILSRLDEKHGADFARHLYKITLTGSLPESENINLELLRSRLQNELYFVKLRNKTELIIEGGDESQSLKGIFIRRMESAAADETLRKAALNLGVRAFSGEVFFDED